MERQTEPKASIGKRTVAGLIAMAFLLAACQSSNGGGNNTASNQDNQAANARATPPNGQTNNQAGANNAADANRNSAGNLNASGPSIEITEVPSKGAGPEAVETIAGKVAGVKVKDCKVVVFARTDKWYVQPYIASPDTTINDDGTWDNDTHLGSEYAALLVKSGYRPPSTTGTLPSVGGNVLAVARATAKK